MSPRNSIAVWPSRAWATASSVAWLLIASSFPVHDQLDRVAGAVRVLAQLVDHLLDEEQAPAARRLAAGELLLDVGHGRRRELAVAAVIDDAHHVCRVADADRDVHEEVG